MNERESMPDSFESTEDLQEPSQPVCPALPVQPPDVQAPPDSVPVAALTGDQENLSILNGHQNFFVPALSDADHQVMILHVSNGTFQQTEQDEWSNRMVLKTPPPILRPGRCSLTKYA